MGKRALIQPVDKTWNCILLIQVPGRPQHEEYRARRHDSKPIERMDSFVVPDSERTLDERLIDLSAGGYSVSGPYDLEQKQYSIAVHPAAIGNWWPDERSLLEIFLEFTVLAKRMAQYIDYVGSERTAGGLN